MTIHDLGYRSWEGKRRRGHFRWRVVGATSIRLAWRNLWLRRMLVLAWVPAIYLGFGFFLYEQAVDDSLVARRALRVAFQYFSEAEPLLRGVALNVESARHEFWSTLLLIFLRYLQGTIMILLVGMVVPTLVTQDLRSRAYLLYFSHPLPSWEYLLGKGSVIAAYLSLITTIPGVALYVVGVMLSPDLSVVGATWDLPLRVIAASVVMIIPTASIALMFSSMTMERRNAGFGWFAFWAVGWTAYRALSRLDVAGVWWWVSLNHIIGKAQSSIFGLDRDGGGLVALVMLAVVSLVALSIARLRILAPLRA